MRRIRSFGIARRWFAPALLVVMGASCSGSSDPVEPAAYGVGHRAAIQPPCRLGCGGGDPNPSAAGVYLGGITPSECYRTNTNLITDSDGDLLGDLCEDAISAAFAPELYYAYGDDVRREPYWAAQWIDHVNGKVEVAYLLSYYRDTGSKQFPVGLGAHNGDSEYIILDVYYDWESQHWVLDQAIYSQHTFLQVFQRGDALYPTALTYPSHPGTFPLTWVSEGKHANYATESDCNNGGFEVGGEFGNDTCVDNNTSAQVEMADYWNIGSRASHTIDCVVSRNPSYEYYGLGRQECYWTAVNFRGWVPDSIGGGDSGTSYSSILSGFSF